MDGTLARHESGWGIDLIGPPVEPMLRRVKELLAAGVEIRIFTARATMGPEVVRGVREWLHQNGLPQLRITSVKDPDMVFFYDDRAVQVERNTGRILGRELWGEL